MTYDYKTRERLHYQGKWAVLDTEEVLGISGTQTTSKMREGSATPLT